MPAIVVVGAQWGDEGKGKVVDALAERAALVVRYQGGANAGHTVDVGDDEYVLHQIPSGMVRGCRCVIGNGVVTYPSGLIGEMEDLQRRGIEITPDNFKISDRAHVIMDYHIKADQSAHSRGIGTTGRGIGPAYTDKVARKGIRIGDLAALDIPEVRDRVLGIIEEHYKIDSERFFEALEQNYKVGRIKLWLLKHLFGDPRFTFDPRTVLDPLEKEFEKLKPYITDTSQLVEAFLRRGENVLLEGAQGGKLDVDHGTYPFVTSSNTTTGGAISGIGIDPAEIKTVLGVAKAYTTRVGGGPMPTEQGTEEQIREEFEWERTHGRMTQADPEFFTIQQRLKDGTATAYDIGKYLRVVGDEYGATTGRPRRCGHFDSVVVRDSCRVAGISGLVVTKIDILSGLRELRMCEEYDFDGERMDRMPPTPEEVKRCEPVYRDISGWEKDISTAEKWDDMPREAIDMIHRIEETTGKPVLAVSNGKGRLALIHRDSENDPIGALWE